jgi:hypothetical protein
MDAALCAPLLETAGAACPKAGVAAAVANVTNKRKSRRCTFMLPSLSWFRRQLSYKATPLRARLEWARGVCTWPEAEATLAAGGVRTLGSTCRQCVGPNPPLVTRLRHAARKDTATQQSVGSRNERHCGLMLAARITLPHLSVSSAMSSPKSAGEPDITLAPSAASLALIAKRQSDPRRLQEQARLTPVRSRWRHSHTTGEGHASRGSSETAAACGDTARPVRSKS